MQLTMSEFKVGDVIVTNETVETDSTMICVERVVVEVLEDRLVVEVNGEQRTWVGDSADAITVRRNNVAI